MKYMIDAIQTLEFNNGKFPKNEIQQIIENKEEAIPFLLEIMEEVRDNPQKYRNESKYFGPIYAIYLLAQFRVVELYPILIDILSLPDDMPDEIFGDSITEDMGRILASVSAGNVIPLKNLIENSEVNEYVRGQALYSLVTLVLNDQLEREEVFDYFKQLMNGKLDNVNYYVNAEIVGCANRLYPLEIYDEIAGLYARGEVETFIISLEDIESTLKETKEAVMHRSQHDSRYQFIDDTINELAGWACFTQKIRHNPPVVPPPSKIKRNTIDSVPLRNPAVKIEKIGRNDPCSCGSGQKYKKCCGK